MNNYQTVTDRIVAMLESGTAPWSRPWQDGAPEISGFSRPLRVNGTPYRGVNAINLWAAAQARGFTSQTWMTFKAAKDMGASVRKGAKAELAFYVGQQTKVSQNDAGEDVERSISFLRAYCVFNANEIDNLPARYTGAAPITVTAEERDADAECFVRATGAVVRHGGNRAYYMPSQDCVTMPAFGAFRDAGAYYSTLLHELTHWTSASARCDRQLGKRFGDEAYAAEELVAELGAAFLCADLAISPEPRPDHASYIASWIKVLKADNRAIFRAAALAEKAAGYLHGLQDASEAADDNGEGMKLAA